MISLNLEVSEFAAKRRTLQDDLVERLQGVIGATFGEGDIENLDKAIETMFREVYESETDKRMRRGALNRLRRVVRHTLGKAGTDANVHVTALMVAQVIINAATIEAADADDDPLLLEWVTMHDGDVRPAHAEADGQTRPPGENFDVAEHEMPYPGYPGVPVELWINCRCVLKPTTEEAAIRAALSDVAARLVRLNGEGLSLMQREAEPVPYAKFETRGVTMTTTAPEKDVEEIPEVPAEEAEAPAEDVAGVPFHGVLAPEGIASGDGRTFAPGALRNRDLPLPLTWQEVSAEGHDQNITVAKIEKVQVIDGLMEASGHFLSTVAKADNVIGLIGEFGKFGVSVDADDAEFEFDEETETVIFSDARVCSACIVSIPAFAEAYIALGPHPVLDAEEEVEATGQVVDLAVERMALTDEDRAAAAEAFREVPQDERDERADDGSAMPDGSYPIANCEDLSNAIQAIGRAKDPAPVKQHIKKRAGALDCPDVSLPEDWAGETVEADADTESWSDIEQFLDVAPGKTEDGPGWLTHPVDTDRLRDYWVRGPGAADVAWGTPGDFNRCRANVAGYVKPQYLNGYCANRHYDALGFWPGEHSAAKDTLEFTEMSPAINLVAAAVPTAPAGWFTDPEFAKDDGRLVQYTDGAWGCPQTITEEGEVFGHVARWGTCHIGLGGKCTTAPPSKSDYDYFAMGEVLTDAGPVRVGQLTIDTGHADARAPLKIAAAHYDDTGAVWADVAVGEDEFGIWYHGWVRPGTAEETIYKARASGQLSGDWRGTGPNEYEMVAALSVNVPGFPTPRPKVGLVAGAQVSLTAAGMVEPVKPREDNDNIKAIAAAVADELEGRKKRVEKMAALKERVTAGAEGDD